MFWNNITPHNLTRRRKWLDGTLTEINKKDYYHSQKKFFKKEIKTVIIIIQEGEQQNFKYW